MSWSIKDEYIELAQARHVVIYANKNGGEHHLYHHFKMDACPHCGTVKEPGEPIDFHQVKRETLEALNAHHDRVMEYRKLHPNVRVK